MRCDIGLNRLGHRCGGACYRHVQKPYARAFDKFAREVNILMGNSSVLLACSVPMGDIFEGRNITCGVPVRPGRHI